MLTRFSSYYEKFADGKVVCIDDEIPFEIPSGWEWCRIRDISQSYIGLTYKPTDVTQTGTIVLRSSNIQEGQLDLNDIVRVSTPIPDKLWVEENDIVICARNGSKKLVGKSAIVDSLKEPMTFGAFMAICKTPIFRYVYNFLQSELFYAQLRGVSGTTTINQLTQNNFNNFLIPIPPLGEQQRIDERLQIIIPIVNKYGESQEKLDVLNNSLSNSFRKSILQEAIQGRLVPQDDSDEPSSVLLQRIREEKLRLVKEGKLKKKDVVDSVIYKGDDNKYYEKVGRNVVDITEEIPFEIPESWEWCHLGSFCELIGGYAFPSESLKGNTGIRVIRISDISESGFVNNRIVRYNGKETLSAYNIRVGDILIAMTGGTVGKSLYVTDMPEEILLNQRVAIIRNEFMNKEYINYVIRSPYIKDVINEKKNSTNDNISMKDIYNFFIPVPSIEEQKRIVMSIEQILKEIKGN